MVFYGDGNMVLIGFGWLWFSDGTLVSAAFAFFLVHERQYVATIERRLGDQTNFFGFISKLEYRVCVVLVY